VTSLYSCSSFSFVSGQAGCISGEAQIAFNRQGAGRTMTLRDFVIKFNGGRPPGMSGRPWDQAFPTFIQHEANNGTIRLTRVIRAWSSGIKRTFTVTTHSGQTIRATAEHPFLTTDGWKQLHELSGIDISVHVRGQQRVNGRAPKKCYPTISGLWHHPFASRRAPTTSNSQGQARIPLHRLVMEAYQNDLSLDVFLERVFAGEVTGLNFIDPSLYAVHHKDRVPTNNARSNLSVITHDEHRQLHAREGTDVNVAIKVAFDFVMSIVPFGEEETFDIEVDAEGPRNFVADGFVVHNTGKTFLARQWAEESPEAIMLATTGIAAINLGGTTINALIGYFDTENLKDYYGTGRLHARLRQLRDAGTRWLILDEVSMLSAEQLTCLVRAIRAINIYAKDDDDMIRLTVVGDFGQLPPVDEPFAFESPEWSVVCAETIKLTEIKRQAEKDFIEALQAVRNGDPEKALDFFGSRLQIAPQMNFQGTMIKAKNDDVNRYNELRMDDLTSASTVFTKQVSGDPRGEWKIVPPNLHLKIGALVMVLANKRIKGTNQFEYVNGDLGLLEDVDGPNAYVTLQRTGQTVCVEPVTREHQRPLTAGRRQELVNAQRYEDIKGKHEVVGRMTYMPLRAAWASTVHKSQGLSFDSVQVDIRNHFFTQSGMLYVALSRARTAAGLRIVGSPMHFRKRCTVNPKTLPWL
jgi:ATP-dependent DNA helicase PIF1